MVRRLPMPEVSMQAHLSTRGFGWLFNLFDQTRALCRGQAQAHAGGGPISNRSGQKLMGVAVQRVARGPLKKQKLGRQSVENSLERSNFPPPPSPQKI